MSTINWDCHLPLQGLNHVLLQLLVFNTSWKEFRVKSIMRHSVLWENWQIGLQTDIFRSQSCEPNSCISSYLESWVLKNWCFWTVVLDKTLESPLDCKEIQPVRPEGDQSWVLLEGLMLKLKLQYFGYLMWRADSFENTLMAGNDWGLEEKGATVDKLFGWYHWLNGHGFGWTPGVGDGQGGLACCDPWGCKELDVTERLNWYILNWLSSMVYNTTVMLDFSLSSS